MAAFTMAGSILNFRNVDKDFLYYLLKYRQKFFFNAAYGAAIQNINTEILREMEVELPSIEAQHNIALVLSVFDELIENNNRRIDILEKIIQIFYREWFVKFNIPNLAEVTTFESPYGVVPVGWNWVNLEDIAEINSLNIRTREPPETIGYIDISSVTTGRIEQVAQLRFSEAPGRARRILRNGDIIWSTVRPNRKSFALILNPSVNLIASTGFAVISPKSVPYTFLYCAVTTNEFANYLSGRATGSAYPAVNDRDFKKAKVLLPPLKLLEEFHRLTVDFFLLKKVLLETNRVLVQTKDQLLPKLVSGKVELENSNCNKLGGYIE
jgi:type I restriction enzyme S subunit